MVDKKTKDDRITLKINNVPMNFMVTTEDHERLIDELQPNNKCTPMHNFLIRTVDKDSKKDLAPHLKHPSSIMEISTKVLEVYSPKLKIILGE